jgi:hypothetical protein
VDKSFIELLKTVGNQIDHAELNAAIKADNFEGEFALSEDGLASAKDQVGKLLTLEAAVNNSTVIEKINKESYPKHMKTALTKVEDQLRPIMDKLGIDLEGAEFISDKIGDIEDKLSEAMASGDKKEVIEKLNEELRLAREVPTKLEQEFNTKIQEKEESYRVEKLRDKFILKANEFIWADAYADKDLKRALLNQKWDKINAKAHLTLSDEGDIRLMQKDMPEKELYDGNNKLMTFQSLLEPELEPYLKKSSPEKVTTTVSPKADTKVLNPQEARNLKEQNAQREMYAQ